MPGNWVHLTTAPDQMTAEFWLTLLKEEGIPAMIRPSDSVSYLGVSGFGCRIQVIEEYEERAHQVLADVADA